MNDKNRRNVEKKLADLREKVEDLRLTFCEGNYENKKANEIDCKKALLKFAYDSEKCHHCLIIDAVLKLIDEAMK